MGDGSISVCQVNPHQCKISLDLLGFMDQLADDTGMLQSPWESWKSTFLDRGIYKSTLWHIILGAFNKFPDFFVQAFKIGVDSWKFSTLLLYILWDDWPIFMISPSNEQLQQELEYTLLKPDCQSWWISKMQSGCDDTLEERYAIKFYFKLGKNATETYGMLQTVFGASCMKQATVFEWHKRFKEARESVRDDEMCGRSKEANRPELIGQRVRVRVKVTMLRF